MKVLGIIQILVTASQALSILFCPDELTYKVVDGDVFQTVTLEKQSASGLVDVNTMWMLDDLRSPSSAFIGIETTQTDADTKIESKELFLYQMTLNDDKAS